MTNDLIQQFIEEDRRRGVQVRIHFKVRSTIVGLFIEGRDYNEMKKKNFWRIVPASRMEEWLKNQDPSISRIFNGAEFTRLSDA
jgi:hypothetical protein